MLKQIHFFENYRNVSTLYTKFWVFYRSKTPSQLAEMHTLGDIPIKGLWEGDRGRPSHRA